MNQTLRFPAEWEAQSGVLIAWPTADTDWADRLGQVEETYIARPRPSPASSRC